MALDIVYAETCDLKVSEMKVALLYFKWPAGSLHGLEDDVKWWYCVQLEM